MHNNRSALHGANATVCLLLTAVMDRVFREVVNFRLATPAAL